VVEPLGVQEGAQQLIITRLQGLHVNDGVVHNNNVDEQHDPGLVLKLEGQGIIGPQDAFATHPLTLLLLVIFMLLHLIFHGLTDFLHRIVLHVA